MFGLVIQAAWPVILQQARQRAIREYPTTGLALCAVVGFVILVANPLHRRLAYRTGFGKLAMYGHVGAKSRHFARKFVPGLDPKSVTPIRQH